MYCLGLDRTHPQAAGVFDCLRELVEEAPTLLVTLSSPDQNH